MAISKQRKKMILIEFAYWISLILTVSIIGIYGNYCHHLRQEESIRAYKAKIEAMIKEQPNEEYMSYNKKPIK